MSEDIRGSSVPMQDRLTDAMHDAVRDSEVGKYLDRLIREDIARGGAGHHGNGGNIIQQLWTAFMSGRKA